MSVEIQTINIKVDDEELELTPEQARELKDILDELIEGQQKVTITPSAPIFIEPEYWLRRRYDWWEVKPTWSTWYDGDCNTNTSDGAPYEGILTISYLERVGVRHKS